MNNRPESSSNRMRNIIKGTILHHHRESLGLKTLNQEPHPQAHVLCLGTTFLSLEPASLETCMAYTETCMKNLLPAGVFLRTAVLELGRQLIVVTAPADGILVAVSSSRSAGRRMFLPNTYTCTNHQQAELLGREGQALEALLQLSSLSCQGIFSESKTKV